MFSIIYLRYVTCYIQWAWVTYAFASILHLSRCCRWISRSWPCSCVHRRSVACWCQIQLLNLSLFLLYLTVKLLFVCPLSREQIAFASWTCCRLSYDRCVRLQRPTLIELIKHDTPLAIKQYWTNQNSGERIRMLFIVERSISWKRGGNALFWTHFSWF